MRNLCSLGNADRQGRPSSGEGVIQRRGASPGPGSAAPAASGCLAFLSGRRLWQGAGNEAVRFHSCRPVQLSVGKGGFPAHFVINARLAGAVAISLPWDWGSAPPRRPAEWAPHSGAPHCGHAVVVSCKRKDPRLRHHCTSYPRDPALFTVPHLYSKFRHLFFFFPGKEYYANI